ncbi:MAG: F0F1 ATP synthase subunit epsilon [Alphaproteobacteria bacterium]|nr:F0F1 ATP synthase subunit epsilon [Alphaproteobacteria bacterium]
MSQETFTFELVSPERLLASGQAESVVVPGADGDFMVFSNHAPVVSTLRPGVIDVVFPEQKSARYFVKAGLVEVNGSRCTVLAQDAEDVKDLDSDRITEEISQAERLLANAGDDHDARALAERTISQLKSLV